MSAQHTYPHSMLQGPAVAPAQLFLVRLYQVRHPAALVIFLHYKL